MDLEIIEIAEETKNNKYIKNHTHSSKLKNHLCGDEIQIKLIIKKRQIIDFAYEGESCIYCQASASLLSKILIKKDIIEMSKLCNDAESYFSGDKEIIEKKWIILKRLFKPKNITRKECILLPFKALKKLIYQIKL